MPHFRERYLSKKLKELLRFSPSLCVLGMRQTGKSTLLKSLASRYLTFDDDSLPGRLDREGDSLLLGGEFPLCLDEAQKSPVVFDRIKRLIDEKRVPGRFLLTGSIRFSARREIGESLTGRTLVLELKPFSAAEIAKRQQARSLEAAFGKKTRIILKQWGSTAWLSEHGLQDYLKKGGMPGICLVRSAEIRAKMWEQHLDALLGRDLSFIYKTEIPTRALRGVLAWLSARQGQPLSWAELGREFSISAPTARKLIFAFEGLFLLRRHGNWFFVEDPGLAQHLAGPAWITPRSAGLSAVYHEIQHQITAQGMDSRLEMFHTRGGAEVPFVMRSSKGVVAITVDAGERVSEKSLKSLGVLRKKTRVPFSAIALHHGNDAFETSAVACMPLSWLF